MPGLDGLPCLVQVILSDLIRFQGFENDDDGSEFVMVFSGFKLFLGDFDLFLECLEDLTDACSVLHIAHKIHGVGSLLLLIPPVAQIKQKSTDTTI